MNSIATMLLTLRNSMRSVLRCRTALVLEVPMHLFAFVRCVSFDYHFNIGSPAICLSCLCWIGLAENVLIWLSGVVCDSIRSRHRNSQLPRGAIWQLPAPLRAMHPTAQATLGICSVRKCMWTSSLTVRAEPPRPTFVVFQYRRCKGCECFAAQDGNFPTSFSPQS
jgi:hypothetical protein